jgi:uncharacterized protein
MTMTAHHEPLIASVAAPPEPSAVAGLEIEVAATPLRRMVGLLGRPALPAGRGLLITPCTSVHTMAMRFDIDVVYLDREGVVVKVEESLRPWRMSSGGRRARYTLELAAGEAARLGIARGVTVALPA